MDDKQIIELFFNRDEAALSETQEKYGKYCLKIAGNILEDVEDSKECVNDALVTVWNKIPPLMPASLKAFLGKIVRDISLSKYRENHAKKRYNAMTVMLEELEECIPSGINIEDQTEKRELIGLIDDYLEGIKTVDRVLFVRRYYFGEAVNDLAEEFGFSENKVSQRLLKIRRKLKTFVENGGYEL